MLCMCVYELWLYRFIDVWIADGQIRSVDGGLWWIVDCSQPKGRKSAWSQVCEMELCWVLGCPGCLVKFNLSQMINGQLSIVG